MIRWAQNRSLALQASFGDMGVTSVFSSSCRTHDFTEHDSVYETKINDISFAEQVYEFVTSGGERRMYNVEEDIFPESNPNCVVV